MAATAAIGGTRTNTARRLTASLSVPAATGPTTAALRRGIDRGDIREDADIDLLLDMLAATTYYRVLFGHLPIIPTLAEDVVTIVLTGVATPQWRAHAPH